MLDPIFAWLRSVHDRYARVILAGIAALLVPLMALTLVATADNWRQDNERDQLLACFDQYANTQATGSTAVRAATVKQGNALRVAARELGNVFRSVVNGTLTDKSQLEPMVDALEDFERASKQLDQARIDNPVPDPPSEFCPNS